MTTIEHTVVSAPAPTTPRRRHSTEYRFAQLVSGNAACASGVGRLLELPSGGGR